MFRYTVVTRLPANSQVRRPEPQSRYAAGVTRGVIVLIGSGETAPSMTKVHRQLLARYENPRLRLLDTTYGFQENVPQMTQKLVDYFATSLHVDLEPVSFPRYDPASTVENALVKQRVSDVAAGVGVDDRRRSRRGGIRRPRSDRGAPRRQSGSRRRR